MTRPAPWLSTPAGRRSAAAAIERAQARRVERQRRKALAARRRAAQRPRKLRKRVRQRSGTMLIRDREEKRLLAVWWALPENKRCRRCGAMATDHHHVVPKSVAPGLILVPSNWMPLCRRCHDHIKNCPAEAYSQGWLRRSQK